MKTEKILTCIVVALIVLCIIVYFTLPEQGEQIYIPSVESLPEGVEIPEGYKLVDNYTDVYYVETENDIRYYWLVQFSDGSYGWQEVDENGNIVFPNRETESSGTESVDTAPEDTVAEESETGVADSTEPSTAPTE